MSAELQARIGLTATMSFPADVPTTNDGWDRQYNPDPAANRTRIDALLVDNNLVMEKKDIGGVHCYHIIPRELGDPENGCTIVNFHGGGYVGGRGEAGLNEALFVASVGRLATVAVDYRMPPEHPFPAAVDDADAVWLTLSSQLGPARVGLFGTSAGGGIILCLVQRLIARREAVPGAIVCGTPWSDLSETGDSYFVNRYADIVRYEGSLGVKALQYAGGRDLKDPLLSPVYGDFHGFPPTLLLSGTRDLFLSNTVRVERKLRDAGASSHLIVYEGQSHGRYLSGLDVPETRVAAQDMASFFRQHILPKS
ncbi:hypothetical protein ASE00_13590 [Sphingomonas sp. Root710]|uniref:alpha/beta hydrolase fold domain-containing protein n=1 Tax=Sphingomonas sp. Root710 TaxID=1736594 RepID=UPI0006F671CD|nr:alpha/beta hydrolase fold domain-containing protein [Sphingomonas sp. Root710]KRB83016.1 hypothetical protein ASE00_13590 [Sphingomonas sp. Root710]